MAVCLQRSQPRHARAHKDAVCVKVELVIRHVPVRRALHSGLGDVGAENTECEAMETLADEFPGISVVSKGDRGSFAVHQQFWVSGLHACSYIIDLPIPRDPTACEPQTGTPPQALSDTFKFARL